MEYRGAGLSKDSSGEPWDYYRQVSHALSNNSSGQPWGYYKEVNHARAEATEGMEGEMESVRHRAAVQCSGAFAWACQAWLLPPLATTEGTHARL